MSRGISILQWKILKACAIQMWDRHKWRWKELDAPVSWHSVGMLAVEVFHPEAVDTQGFDWSGDIDWKKVKPTRAEYVSTARAVQSLERRGLVECEMYSEMLDKRHWKHVRLVVQRNQKAKTEQIRRGKAALAMARAMDKLGI